MTTTTPRTLRGRRAFTLIELLVVISIIAVLLGVLLPVIGGVRNEARRSTTQATMTNILTASSQFRADNQRFPGVFSQEQLGSSENVDQGFTPMENAILELAGGVVRDPQATRDEFLLVGPFNSDERKVPVDLGRIGDAVGRQYLTLSDDQLAYADADDQRTQQDAIDAHVAVPDVIDAWGYPILMWVRNPQAGATPAFAEVNSDDQDQRAWFYWATNAAFLDSENVGVRFNANQRLNSMLSSSAGEQERVSTLTGLLGAPAYPRSNTSPPVPSRPLGDIILHSPGRDGYYAESDAGEYDRLVYRPTSGGDFEGGLTETDRTIDSINDLLVSGGG